MKTSISSGLSRRWLHALLFASALLLAVPGSVAAQDSSASANSDDGKGVEDSSGRRPGATGLPLPRFVSLRASEVNLRTGPGVRYPIDWVYRRRNLPVEIIDEFDTWRRIRDWQGTIGWVHQSMLQGKRTVMISGDRRLLRRAPDETAPGIAWVEPGMLGDLGACEGAWCQMQLEGYEGWMKREEFYGLYPGETPDN